MIIKIIPETDAEKKRFSTVTHNKVQEFFIMGTKLDDENDAVEFHDWKGGYRSLIGGLAFFLEKIKHEMYLKETEEKENTYKVKLGEKDTNLVNLIKPKMFKTGTVEASPTVVEMASPQEEEGTPAKFTLVHGGEEEELPEEPNLTADKTDKSDKSSKGVDD